jgi:hypothetical protein
VVDPALFPKLRTEPISLVRRGATSQRNKSGKEKQVEQVNLQEVASFQVHSIEDENIGETEQALEGILDFYNPETSEKIESEDENIRKRLTNSIYFGLEELEQLRQMLPDLDKKADEGLETIAEEIELETQEVANEEENVRQSIYLEEEAVESLKEIYQKEASKPSFNPKNFFQGVKKGVDKVKQTGQTVAQKVENSKGFQIAGKVGGVVFNPTTANITKIVAGEVLKAVPGGVFIAGAVEGTFNAAGKIKERRDELRKVQEEAKQATEQRLLTETEEIVGLEVGEVKSDLEIDTIENKPREEDKEDEKETFEYEEESDDDYPQIIETLDSMNTDLKLIKKNTEKLNINDSAYFDRIMNMDARTLSFDSNLIRSLTKYQQEIGGVKTEIASLKSLITERQKLEGDKYNDLSKNVELLVSGTFPGKADYSVEGDDGDENEKGQDYFDMINTARDIQKEVLNVKTDISKVNT